MTKVFIVEDDPWLADSFAHTLSRHDMQVTVATSAAQAIDLIDDAVPDIIVADVILGEANIMALLHELQSYTDTQAVPVILCTTLDLKEQQASGALRPYGVRTVLDKATITPETLVNTVQTVLAEEEHS